MTRTGYVIALALTPLVFVRVGAAQTPSSSPETCVEERILTADPLGSASRDFVRLLEITGRAEIRPHLIRRASSERGVTVCGDAPWLDRFPRDPMSELDIRPLPVRTRFVLNSGPVENRNNGALLVGRGISTAVESGVSARWRFLSAAYAPTLAYTQNLDIVLSPRANRGSIDRQQQIGNVPFAVLDPGRSFARIDARGVALGLSTENVWIGPGLDNSLLLTTNAPGFPHAFLGTGRPVDIWVGHLEAQAIWGKLHESPLFDDNATNDERLLSGLVVDWRPRGVPGLFLGLARIIHEYPPRSDGYIPFFAGALSGGDQDDFDQLIALYARWVLPESGFEAYLEWGRTDTNNSFHDLLVEPDHSRAYVAGFQKVVETAGDRWVRVRGEVTNINPPLPAVHRGGKGFWYTHSVVRQGYTHEGRILGASIGPGADAQRLQADVLGRNGSIGVFGERVRRSMDLFLTTEALRRGGYPLPIDLELRTGVRATTFWRDFEIRAGMGYSHRRNRDFLPPRRHEQQQGYRVDGNWSLEMGLTWRPPARLFPRVPVTADQDFPSSR